MTDITAELAALPKKRAGDVDSLLDFYEARLAIAERLLKFASAASLHDECCSHFSEENAGLIACNCWLRDARAYLAFRAKEQP